MAFPQLTKLEWMTGMVISGIDSGAWDSDYEVAKHAVEIAEQILKQTSKREQNGTSEN